MNTWLELTLNPTQRVDSVRESDSVNTSKGSWPRGRVNRVGVGVLDALPSTEMKEGCGLRCLPISVSQK